MSNDPRRVVVTYHSNSSSPRARRWYSLRVVAETPQGLHELYWPARATLENAQKRECAIEAARSWAAANGLPCLPGVYARGAADELGAPLMVREL